MSGWDDVMPAAYGDHWDELVMKCKVTAVNGLQWVWVETTGMWIYTLHQQWMV